MESAELTKNDGAIKRRILLSSIVVVAIGLAISLFFWLVTDLSHGFERFMFILTWLGLVGLWLTYAVTSWLRWKNSHYILGQDSLIVKEGTLAGSTKDYYRYDSILEVRIEKDRLGQRDDYGDVFVNIPKLHKVIVLRDINHPDSQAQQLKKVIMQSGETKSLVT